MVYFRAKIFLAKLQCGHPIHVVLMPVRSWFPRNGMLSTYLFAVKHIFRFSVSATDRFYPFFSLLCTQFLFKILLCWLPLKVFDKTQSLYLGHFYFHIQKQRKEPFLSFLSHCDLSIGHVCLGTNMADSNSREDGRHVGKNQELNLIRKTCRQGYRRTSSTE